MQPEINTDFLPCLSIIFPKKGAIRSIANEYPLNIIPMTEEGTPFCKASPGKKGAIDEYAEFANRLTKQRPVINFVYDLFIV
jgi:hypothetical protein